MIVFTYGMHKSASTFCNRIVAQIMKQSGAFDKVIAEGDVSRVSRGMLATFNDVILDSRKVVVHKTHGGITNYAKELAAKGVAVATATFRDPREIVLSMLDVSEKAKGTHRRTTITRIASLTEALDRLEVEIDRFQGWAECKFVLPVFYDDISFDTVRTILKISAHLKVHCDPERVAAAFQDKKDIRFNKGIRARYETEMSVDDQQRVLDRFKAFYQSFIEPRLAASSIAGAA